MNKLVKSFRQFRSRIYRRLLKSSLSNLVEKLVNWSFFIKTIVLSPVRKVDIEKQKRSGKYRVLYLTHYDPYGLLTIIQTIQQYVDLSQNSIDILNLYCGMPLVSRKDLQYYDCILIHDTVLFSATRMKLVGMLFLDRFKGLKAIMLQDEHYHTDFNAKYIKKQGIDLLLTLWDEDTAGRVYHKEECPKLHIMQFLTGYIPETYRLLDYDILNRKVDVGYRGSIQPLIFGRLAYEKREIGDSFLQHAEKYGLKCDISSQNEARILGKDWLDFLGNCKATLSVESGSDIVDFDGSVAKQFAKFQRKNPKASEQEVLSFLQPYERDIRYRVIAPRHFEAAACKTLQIMYEGDYQGIFIPYRHYVPLKRDFSNIDEVVQILRDDERRNAIVNCAFDEIVLNDKYSFSNFVKRLDNEIESIIVAKKDIQ